MDARYLATAGMFAGALAWSSAHAALGTVTSDVDMRSGPGTNYSVITTIPAGATVYLHRCASWCEVSYTGRRGWTSSKFISRDYARHTPAHPNILRASTRLRCVRDSDKPRFSEPLCS